MIPYRRWGPYTVPTEAQRIAFHRGYEFSPVGVYPPNGYYIPQPTAPTKFIVSSGDTSGGEKRISPGPFLSTPSHSSPTVSSSTPQPIAQGVQLSSSLTGDGCKTCLICGDRATGLHYGIVSCEGCKGFFKRSICNKRVYKCMKDQNCMMSRHKRNRCQYCRLLRCLQVGMNRKAIREDGMPGGRNKCTGPVNLTYEEIERIMTGQEYIQKQTEHFRSVGVKSPTSDGGSPQSMSSGEHPFEYPPISTVHGSVTRPYLDPSSRGMKDGVREKDIADVKIEPDAGISLVSPNDSASDGHREVDHNRGNGELSLLPEVEGLLAAESEVGVMGSLKCDLPTDRSITYPELFQFLCKLMDGVLHREIAWVKRLPFASTLSVGSTTGMLTDTWLDAVLLAALRGHPRELYTRLARVLVNYMPQEEEVRKFGHAGLEVMDMARALATRYQKMNVSLQEHVCLKVVNYLNPDVRFMTDTGAVEALRKQYYFVLHDHLQLNNNNAAATDRFREILSLLPNIKVLSQKVGDMTFECAPLLFKAMMHACGPQS